MPKRAQKRKPRRKGANATDDVREFEVSSASAIAVILLLLSVGASIGSIYMFHSNAGCMGISSTTDDDASPSALRQSAGSVPVGVVATPVVPQTPPPSTPLSPPTPPPATLRGVDECTADQMAKVKQQLPPETCTGKPYTQRCSFTRATTKGCPDPFYMRRFYAKTPLEQFNAVIIGCKNDFKYVQEILHVGSHDPKYEGAEPCHSPITPSAPVVDKVQLFCVESDILAKTEVMKWSTARSYDDAVVKIEEATLANLEDLSLTSSLKTPKHTLDKFLAVSDDQLPTSEPIHVMRIMPPDPNDYSILLGAMHILHRVRYLEFGYHYLGEWAESGLMHDLIFSKLKDKGFACYWKGGDGNLWRITGCWQDSYGSPWWANVVCVNAAHDDTQDLVKEMESVFATTLQKTQQFGD